MIGACGGLGGVVGFDGDLGSAVFLAFLEADVVFDEELQELGLVVFGEVTELDCLCLSFLHLSSTVISIYTLSHSQPYSPTHFSIISSFKGVLHPLKDTLLFFPRLFGSSLLPVCCLLFLRQLLEDFTLTLRQSLGNLDPESYDVIASSLHSLHALI